MLEAHDKLEILTLYAQYNRCIDAGDSVAWARTFIEGGVFCHPTRDFVGRSQLERFVEDRTVRLATHPCAEQRHWNDAITIEGSANEAAGSCLLLVWGSRRDTGTPEVVAHGHYIDELVKVDSAWHFRRRTLRVD